MEGIIIKRRLIHRVLLISLLTFGIILISGCGNSTSTSGNNSTNDYAKIAKEVSKDQFVDRTSSGQDKDEIVTFEDDDYNLDKNEMELGDVFDYGEETPVHYKRFGDKLKVYKDDYPKGVTKWYLQLLDTPNKIKIVETKDGETKTLTGYSVNHEGDVESKKENDDSNY